MRPRATCSLHTVQQDRQKIIHRSRHQSPSEALPPSTSYPPLEGEHFSVSVTDHRSPPSSGNGLPFTSIVLFKGTGWTISPSAKHPAFALRMRWASLSGGASLSIERCVSTPSQRQKTVPFSTEPPRSLRKRTFALAFFTSSFIMCAYRAT